MWMCLARSLVGGVKVLCSEHCSLAGLMASLEEYMNSQYQYSQHHTSLLRPHTVPVHTQTFSESAHVHGSKQSALNAIHERGCVQSIAMSAAAAPRCYAQVAERLSRAQDSSKPPWSTAGQQHAREQVAVMSMDCARAHGSGLGVARTLAA